LDSEIKAHTHNIGLPQWRVTCFYDTFVVNRSAVLLLNFSAKNPPLRQAENRYNCERKHQSLDYQTPEKLFKKIV
jgi:transposase InsO family protein